MSIEEIMSQSPTPRTHSIWNALVNAGSNPVETGRILGAARKMELELKAANDRIKRLEEFVDQLTNPKFTRDDLPKEALLQRIKRLEKAGDAMAEWLENPRNLGADACLSHAWREAKEAKP